MTENCLVREVAEESGCAGVPMQPTGVLRRGSMFGYEQQRTPAFAGMTDERVSLVNGFLRLRLHRKGDLPPLHVHPHDPHGHPIANLYHVARVPNEPIGQL